MTKLFFSPECHKFNIASRLAFYQDLIAKIQQRTGIQLEIKSNLPGLTSRQKILLGLSLVAGFINTFCDSFGNASVLLTTLIDAPHLAFYLLGATLLFSFISLSMYALHQIVVLSNDYDMPFGFVSIKKNHFDHEHMYLDVLKNFFLQHSFRQNSVFTVDEWDNIKDILENNLQHSQSEYDAMVHSNRHARETRFCVFLRGFLVVGLAGWSMINGFMLGFFSLSMLMFLIPTITVPISVCVVLGSLTAISSFILFNFEVYDEINKTIDRLYPMQETSIYDDVKQSMNNIKIYQDKGSQCESSYLACA